MVHCHRSLFSTNILDQQNLTFASETAENGQKSDSQIERLNAKHYISKRNVKSTATAQNGFPKSFPN